MLGLSTGQRRLLIHVFRELANFGVISWVLGQFLGGRPFSAALAVAGAVLWVVLIAVAFGLAAKEAR